MATNGWIIERTVDLAHPPKTLRNEQPYEIAYTGDMANPVWTVHVLQDGQPVALGGSVKAYIRRIDGAEVISNGTISGNTVSVELGGSNFGQPGYTWGILRYTDSTTNATVTLDALTMIVQADPEGTSVLDPDDMLPTLQELLAELDDMRDATAAAEAAAECIADNYNANATYAVGDYTLHNGGLYRCTTAITSAETWTAAHWTQVVFGNEVEDLESALQNGPCYSVLAKYRDKYDSRELGVTITYQDDGGIHILGTTTEISWANLYMDASKLPDGLIPGNRYYIAYTGVKAKLIVYKYSASGTVNLLETTNYNDYWTAPQSLDGAGIIFRVWLASGQTFNETVYPGVYTEKPNSVLSGEVSQAQGSLSQTQDELEQKSLYIESLARYSAINFLDLVSKTTKPPFQGITYDWLPDGSCHVHGTASSTSYMNIFASQTSLPDWLDKSVPYEISCSSSKVYLYVYDYSTSSPASIGYSNNGLPKTISIPNSCTGIIIRLWVAAGTKVDEIVQFSMMRSNRDLDNVVIYVGNANEYTTDANSIDTNSSMFVGLSNGAPNIANVPYAAGWLDTYIVSNSLRMQRITPYETQKYPVMIRTKTLYGWEPWVAVGQKGHIEAVDTASADETGKTDMRTAIQYALDTYGYCKLGVGVYYISNKIIMPEGSMLEGCGESTELRLMSGDAKVAVLMKKYSIINNLAIIGSYADLTHSDFGASSGSRYGIQYYKGGSDTYTTAYCSISNVHIRNFSGAGIYQYGTGANVEQGLFVSNVHIKNCWCGIWIYSNSEFCRYSNVQMTYCYIDCINNGGNNAFDNCVFHAYSIGMKIDGTQNNSAHGMCSNSSFCHSGGNSGSAVTLSDIEHGYVFSACQYWYNSIDITDCDGIVFSGCEIGRNAPINISGGNTVMFGNCVFVNDVAYPPSISIADNTKVKFTGCYGSVSGNAISA